MDCCLWHVWQPNQHRQIYHRKQTSTHTQSTATNNKKINKQVHNTNSSKPKLTVGMGLSGTVKTNVTSLRGLKWSRKNKQDEEEETKMKAKGLDERARETAKLCVRR